MTKNIKVILYTGITIILIITNLLQAQNNQVRVTIYNDNLALIHEIRELDLPKPTGIRSFQDVAAQIDPTSVHFKSLSHPDAVRVLEQNFEYDLVSAEKILQKYLDKNIGVSIKDGGALTGRLLSSAGNLVLQSEDNSIKILNKSEVISTELPKLPEGLITKPTLVWLVENKGPKKQKIEVSYLTSGMSWHSEYVGVLDANDQNLNLAGWVSIDNKSGVTLPNAQLLLVAGSINRARRPQRPIHLRQEVVQLSSMSKTANGFQEKEFFEYHLYTLSRSSTLKNNQQKQIELLPSVQTPVKKEYTYEGTRNTKKVNVTLKFKNTKKNGLGIALPAGKIRIYKPEGEAQVLVGEDFIEHTPRDEELRIKVGDAFDIVGERTRLNFKRINTRSSEEQIKIEIRNHKSENITVNIVERFSGDWTIRQESLAHTKKDATKAEWQLKVASRGKTNITYTVLRTW